MACRECKYYKRPIETIDEEYNTELWKCLAPVPMSIARQIKVQMLANEGENCPCHKPIATQEIKDVA